MYKNIFVVILITLVIYLLIPYIITILFPNISLASTTFGEINLYLNRYIFIDYICWYAYTILFIYCIYLTKNINNNIVKYTTIFFCLFMIFFPTIPILHFINLFLCLFYSNPPFIKEYHELFPNLIDIEKNVDSVINEYNEYISVFNPEPIRHTNPAFRIEKKLTDTDNSWRTIYLKKVGKINNNLIQYFPKTTELLKDENIHNAFYSILDPEVEIPPHRGYYKGYLRYHLGVDIPNNDSVNLDEKAYIVCDNEKYFWKQSEGVLFDDFYDHYVKNPSGKTRVVLYLDMKRPNINSLVDKIKDCGFYLMDNSLLLKMFVKNQHKQNKV
jgi:aspartyl/asparaginyl beta-hydroxylase (cupin superfamily)